jgi:catechol 2,3-dioxygenase-like lactoylglutathione lyase family enzyme
MNVGGILETSLYVADVSRSSSFYRRLFGFGVLLDSERLVALDVAGRNVLLLFQSGATSEPFTLPSGGVVPGHDGAGRYHLAFSIAAEDAEPWKRRLEAEGVAVESVVAWPGGGASLYFRDPDDHLVELITPGFWRLAGLVNKPASSP